MSEQPTVWLISSWVNQDGVGIVEDYYGTFARFYGPNAKQNMERFLTVAITKYETAEPGSTTEKK